MSEYGMRFKERRISEDKLRKVWDKKFSNKPFPPVRGYRVKYKEFVKIFEGYMQSDPIRAELTKKSEIREHGSSGGLHNVTAFAIDTGVEGFLIFVKTNSPLSLEEDLEHELRHIYNADFITDHTMEVRKKEREWI